MNPLEETSEVRSVPPPRLVEAPTSSTNITITFENLQTLINEAISKQLRSTDVQNPNSSHDIPYTPPSHGQKWRHSPNNEQEQRKTTEGRIAG